MKPLRNWLRHSKIPLTTHRSNVSGTKDLLNFPKSNLKNCSWHKTVRAKKSTHLENKLYCWLVYKLHSDIIVRIMLQNCHSQQQGEAWMPHSLPGNLWQDPNRVWHNAASFLSLLILYEPQFHFKYKPPVTMTHWNMKKISYTWTQLMPRHLSAFAQPETTAQSHSSQWGLTQIPNDNSADI